MFGRVPYRPDPITARAEIATISNRRPCRAILTAEPYPFPTRRVIRADSLRPGDL